MKYKFFTFLVLIVSVLFFYNVQDVNAGCTAFGPVWSPNPAPWKNTATAQTFNFTQNYTTGNDPVGDAAVLEDSCIAAATNGAKCQVMGVHLTAYQDFDPCPEFGARQTLFDSPVNRIDMVAPSCGAPSWTNNGGGSYTLTSASDTLSGLNATNAYSCTTTAGNRCTLHISDNAGNITDCQSPVYNPAPTLHNATATAGSGGSITSTNPVVGVADGDFASFTVTTNPGFTRNIFSPTDCPVGSFSSNTYSTGIFSSTDPTNCTINFTFTESTPPPTPLSCAHDTNQAEPIYPNAGAKFRATGGDGTYSWSYSDTPAAGNATTGVEVWPAWTDSGTKTAIVGSGPWPDTQFAQCTVYITPAPILPSGSLLGSSCTIPIGGSSCNTSLDWNVLYPIGTSNVTSNTSNTGSSAPGTVVATGNSGTNVPATVPYSNRTFFLNNNGATLAQATPTATCISGSVWNGTSCQSAVTPLNGVCASTHNDCDVGISVDLVDNASFYLWRCNGSGGGTNASCSEEKIPSPDLTVSAPTPSTAMVGTPVTFTSTISNTGDASTGISFYNLFQRASASNGGGTISDITPSLSTATLTAGTTRVVSSSPYTFTTVGTYSVRACADKSSGASPGTITESNEDNNCSPWTNLTVVAFGPPDLIASAPTPSTDVALNVARTYTSIITNQGGSSTGVSFPYFLQLSSPWYNEAGATFYDLPSKTMSALNAGGNASVTDSVAFNGLGHKSLRFCADKTSSAGGGVVTEGDENNNCGPWTNITVTSATLYPILSVGGIDLSNYVIASLNKNPSTAWYSKLLENSSESIHKAVVSIAHAAGAIAGLPLRMSTVITNSGIPTSTTFINKYFIDINNDNPAVNTGLDIGWDSTYTVNTPGIASSATASADVPAGLPQGTHGIVFCSDFTGVVSDPAQSLLSRCTSKITSSVGPATSMTGTLTASNCTLASGRCDTNLVWTTTNPEATSAVTTPTNITVGTGLNNSGTYTMTSPGNRTFYLYNNAKLLAQATATASDSPAPSCTPTTTFRGSVTPTSVSIFGPYTVSCDFGVVSEYVGASVGSGSCSWGGWSNDTQANFDCNAGVTPGSYSNNCIINYNDAYPYCSSSEAVDPLTVTSMPGGRIDGVCSNPDDHVNPCLAGTPSAVVNGISSWTWSCTGSGVGHTDASCEELKKKPKFEED